MISIPKGLSRSGQRTEGASQMPNSGSTVHMRANIPGTSPRARHCANGFISIRRYYYSHFQNKQRLREGRELAHSHTISGGAECLCYWLLTIYQHPCGEHSCSFRVHTSSSPTITFSHVTVSGLLSLVVPQFSHLYKLE